VDNSEEYHYNITIDVDVKIACFTTFTAAQKKGRRDIAQFAEPAQSS
jgi:hypothetical protein